MHWADAASLILLLLLSAELFFSAAANSATFDEPYHITRGLTYLRTGDLRMMYDHPPLIDMVLALPLALDRSIVLPLNDSSWQQADKQSFADLLLWRVNSDGPWMVTRARLPIMGLTLALAILVYVWARRLYGPAAALLPLALFAFDPNVIAIGEIATNDMGVTFFVTLAVYAFWRFLHQPCWHRAAGTGIIVGLAEASKFSALFLIPALIVILLVGWWPPSSEKGGHPSLKRITAYLALIALMAGITVWAIYGFQVGQVKGYAIPAQAYLEGVLFVKGKLANAKPAFLLGSYSDTGWWYYFPLALAVKTPVPTLLFVFVGVGLGFRRRWRLMTPLLIPCLVYLGLGIATSWNIGYRLLLPALPFLFILAGHVGQVKWRSKAGALTGLLLGWLVVGSLLSFPHYFSYFNEIAGGANGGHRVLGDSNLDWGQDLIGLRDYMAAHQIAAVRLSYLGSAEPRAYGVEYERMPGFPGMGWKEEEPETIGDPGPGIYAISVGNLQGTRLKNHDLYAWFRDRKPEAIIGHSIYVYRVMPAQ